MRNDMKWSIDVECSCLSFNRYKSLLTSNEYPHLLRKNKYDSNAFCANFFINPKKQQQQQQKIGEFVLITAEVACKLWFSSWPPSDMSVGNAHGAKTNWHSTIKCAME